MIQPNVTIIENFISNPDVLLATLLNDVEWEYRVKSRKTASYGIPYDYSGLSYAARPMHPDLVTVCTQIFLARDWWPNNCLLNLYSTGRRTMGFHVDDCSSLHEGTGVVIVSLGAEREIVYRLIDERSIEVRYRLSNGSFLHMGEDVQKLWQHGIPKSPGAEVRISLTFRKVLHPSS